MPTFTNSTSATATGSSVSYTSTTRWAYLKIENTATAAGTGTLYVRTDGTAAAVGGDGTVSVNPGEVVVVANSLGLWSQAASVIPAGTYPTGSVLNSGTPPEIQPYGSSLYGGTTNPGTNVTVIGTATLPTFTISGTG